MTDFTSWIIEQGVRQDILEMLIFIPVLATLVSIVRYVIGLKTFGIYAPILLAISYSLTGLRYGLILTTAVAISTVIGYTTLRRIRMHYTTRLATNYVIVAILVTFAIALFGSLPYLNLENFRIINPLGVVSIVALSDFFVKTYVKKSPSATIRVIAETTMVAIVGWYLITSDRLIGLIMENLWVVPVLLVFNLIIGRYQGLRFKDIFRFKTALKE